MLTALMLRVMVMVMPRCKRPPLLGSGSTVRLLAFVSSRGDLALVRLLLHEVCPSQLMPGCLLLGISKLLLPAGFVRQVPRWRLVQHGNVSWVVLPQMFWNLLALMPQALLLKRLPLGVGIFVLHALITQRLVPRGWLGDVL